MHLPPFCLEGGEGGELNLLPNFQKGGVGRTLVFRGGFVKKRGVTFLMGRGGGGVGGCNFYLKNKLKSEIFNDKKI